MYGGGHVSFPRTMSLASMDVSLASMQVFHVIQFPASSVSRGILLVVTVTPVSGFDMVVVDLFE